MIEGGTISRGQLDTVIIGAFFQFLYLLRRIVRQWRRANLQYIESKLCRLLYIPLVICCPFPFPVRVINTMLRIISSYLPSF